MLCYVSTNQQGYLESYWRFFSRYTHRMVRFLYFRKSRYRYCATVFSQYQPQPLGQKKVYSVLLPLIKIRGEWHILYQVRSETIPQPGDVSFPGGAVEAGESLQEAAIRETCEELQLDPGQIDLFGEIDYFVHYHRTIHCFVGQVLVEDWQSIQPNHDEVARIFPVPLKSLMQEGPTYHSLALTVDLEQDFPFDRIHRGQDYPFPERARSIPPSMTKRVKPSGA